ncbi:discoidin domain-containing protein [Methylothermus subterraneus]
MEAELLDDFKDLYAWSAHSSVRAHVALKAQDTPRGRALRLEFEFHRRYGFVVARQRTALALPPSYAFSFLVRGWGKPCGLEFKLVDASDQNVWRYCLEEFAFPEDFQELKVESRQLEFAWGPQGEGTPQRISALEFALTPTAPGKGWMEILGLRLRDETYRGVPKVSASSALAGYEASQVLAANTPGWRSGLGEPQWLLIDFGQSRTLGGLAIAWEPGREALAFEVQLSLDGKAWECAYATRQGGARRSYVSLQARARYLKLRLLAGTGQGFGIRWMEVKPPEFSRSLESFVAAVAKESPVGWYPKYWLGRQSYWTPTGTPHSGPVALLNEEGLVEVGEGGFSLQPFLYLDGRLCTWREAVLTQGLEQGGLPLPWVKWELAGLVLTITAFLDPAGAGVYLRFVLSSAKPLLARLFVAILPFQVVPYWQKVAGSGVFAIYSLKWSLGQVLINGTRRVLALTPASGFGAAAFSQGPIAQYLSAGELPLAESVDDPSGLASGALRFDLNLDPASPKEIWLAAGRMATFPAPDYPAAVQAWQTALALPEFELPQAAQEMLSCLKTCAAHIFVNRAGVALRPGPRRYRRAWIRDGVGMGIALARLGMPQPLRDFLTWYGGFQAEDGSLPDCVDEDGPEWLPEFDAYGQFLHGVAEYWRLTGDADWVRGQWPRVEKTLACLENLRAQRLTAEYRRPDLRAYFGLLPESMSHEGYMAQPVHAFWDDLWALRGLRDAAWLAQALGDPAQAARLEAQAVEFKQNIRDAVEAVCSRLGLEYVPGSVELGDFDPSAIAIACALGVEDCLPRLRLKRTFARYLQGLNGQRLNYSPYEVRIVQALVRLGRREEAQARLKALLADRRPWAWNQWPEIAWRDREAPCFLGDLPHSWVGAEYILAVLSLFAYEREDTLVLAAGIPWEWLRQGEVGVKGLPTRYGKLCFALEREGKTLRLRVGGEIDLPPAGVVVELPRRVQEAAGEGWTAAGRTVRLKRVPQTIRLRI